MSHVLLTAIIKGKQCTIVWYVDVMKTSHMDAGALDVIIKKFEEKLGKMTITQGNEHTFLGMQLEYKRAGTVTITMKEYLVEETEDSGLDIVHTRTIPAKKGHFNLDDESPKLDMKQADIFHSIVAKLLYVAMRAHTDILSMISFLCTRVLK